MTDSISDGMRFMEEQEEEKRKKSLAALRRDPINQLGGEPLPKETKPAADITHAELIENAGRVLRKAQQNFLEGKGSMEEIRSAEASYTNMRGGFTR